eukprot:TRINITY_DN2083_c0_g1_i2.p1 TRINITY_DN2083_c0_g1~~TRINITY_DN2083_c0_g1_i2.p1  ORF type:complete len:372 (-),score=131.26 TRINITY_DN2083_c0_g1_i2:40-1155(-)
MEKFEKEKKKRRKRKNKKKMKDSTAENQITAEEKRDPLKKSGVVLNFVSASSISSTKSDTVSLPSSIRRKSPRSVTRRSFYEGITVDMDLDKSSGENYESERSGSVPSINVQVVDPPKTLPPPLPDTPPPVNVSDDLPPVPPPPPSIPPPNLLRPLRVSSDGKKDTLKSGHKVLEEDFDDFGIGSPISAPPPIPSRENREEIEDYIPSSPPRTPPPPPPDRLFDNPLPSPAKVHLKQSGRGKSKLKIPPPPPPPQRIPSAPERLPPPPPSPSRIPTDEPKVLSPKNTSPPPAPEPRQGDTHSSLLEQIRGGMKLKSVNVDKEKKEDLSSGSTVAALLARRMAIAPRSSSSSESFSDDGDWSDSSTDEEEDL